jgi:hypothetical protein
VPGGTSWYQLGDGFLGLRSEVQGFLSGFDGRFADCASEGEPQGDQPRVSYDLRHSAEEDAILVTLSGASFSQIDFALPLYSLSGYALGPTRDGWRMISVDDDERPCVAVSQRHLVADAARPWQRFVANLAVNQVLGMQRHALFFHGASVDVGGRSLIILGGKGAGKTTLGLGLAARGHRCFGDEIAGVDTNSLRMLPVPRTLALRAGPTTSEATRALSGRSLATERLSDGTTRRRVRISEFFPHAAPNSSNLDTLLILRGRRRSPHAERVQPGWDNLTHFAPLGCSLWFDQPGETTMRLLSLLARVRCFFLEAGSPDSTTRFLERLMGAE